MAGPRHELADPVAGATSHLGPNTRSGSLATSPIEHVIQSSGDQAIGRAGSASSLSVVLTTLLSARISSDIGADAAKELFVAGWRTSEAMRDSTWQLRVDALGRGHYVRYDESTARALAETAARTLGVYQGDLHRLASAAEHDPTRLCTLLTEFPRIGLTGA